MVTVDLHKHKPFDETTLTKLEIFERYTEAWAPTFIMRGVERICLFDFFAGTGYDKAGIPGSPIRTLMKLNQFIGGIFQKKVRVDVYFNEYRVWKKELLESAISTFLTNNRDLDRAINVHISNDEFEVSLSKYRGTIEDNPSLVLLDQNGIKFLSKQYITWLADTSQTDFLYFVSSSYMRRFSETKALSKILPIEKELISSCPYKLIHRVLISVVREFIPPKSDLHLYPFSLKKGASIYGIVFGASHPIAVEKFLNIAWAINPVNGDANFDIDDEVGRKQTDLFSGIHKTKRELFEDQLEEKIEKRELTNNHDIYYFTLESGHPTKHARECLLRLKKEGKIQYSGHARISFAAFREQKTVEMSYLS